MVNIRKFDEEQVLDQILHTFWRKGYESTSLDDLVAATGVKRQSLYNAFGNKDEMFITVYERYLARTKQAMEKVGTNPNMPIVDSVRKMLEVLTAEIMNPATPAGCFLANSTVEFAGREDNHITKRLEQHYKDVEDLLYKAFKYAQGNGTLGQEKDPRMLSQFIIGSITSIAVMYRLNKSPDFVKSIIDETLQVLV